MLSGVASASAVTIPSTNGVDISSCCARGAVSRFALCASSLLTQAYATVLNVTRYCAVSAARYLMTMTSTLLCARRVRRKMTLHRDIHATAVNSARGAKLACPVLSYTAPVEIAMEQTYMRARFGGMWPAEAEAAGGGRAKHRDCRR